MPLRPSPIFEQVFVGAHASGLYRLAGFALNGHYRPARQPMPLRTLAQLQAAPSRVWCPMCLALMPEQLGEPCPACGHQEVDGPAPDGERYVMECYAPPETLTRVVALQRHPSLVAEDGPAPVRAGRLQPAPPLEIYRGAGPTLDRVVAEQRRLGHRAPDPTAALTTMETQTPRRCERCGRTYATCTCPPSPPRTLDRVTALQAARLQAHTAAEAAWSPALHRPRGGTL